jgi:hypothetical protein
MLTDDYQVSVSMMTRMNRMLTDNQQSSVSKVTRMNGNESESD